jgi:hypothetical protein
MNTPSIKGTQQPRQQLGGSSLTSQLRLELPKLDGTACVPHQQQHAAAMLPHAQCRHSIPRLLLPVAYLKQPAAGNSTHKGR